MENPQSSATTNCPTCGSRIAKDAPRCLVCGTKFKKTGKGKTVKTAAQEASPIRGSRMPEFTLTMPIILAVFVGFLIIGGSLTYVGLNLTDNLSKPTEVPTLTLTPTPTATMAPETPTATLPPQPSPTPQSYTIQPDDSCSGIAAFFDISVSSLIIVNNLRSDCTLVVGQTLSIPHPTPTITPLASSTPGNIELTLAACEVKYYTVKEGDTLESIAQDYEVPPQRILEWNGKSTNDVFAGERLEIPLCSFGLNDPANINATPTPHPEYSAPQLLYPQDGGDFDLSNDIVSLQWASVGVLQEDEAYQVTVIDLTSGSNIIVVAEVTDTKFVVPTEMRPTDNTPHIFQWFVVPVKALGINEDGDQIFTAAGPVSQSHYFTWTGSAPETTPNP